MAQVSRPHTYVVGITDPDAMNDNEDTIYNEVNGNIDAANIADDCISNAEMHTSAKPVLRDYENFQDRVYTGCTVTSAGLVATVAPGTVYVKGERVSAVAESRTCATSATTYLDLSSAGAYSWNSNASPAVDAMRLYRIVTDASAITSVTDMRTLKAVGAANIEDNACTDIHSAKEVTTTGISTTNTVSAVVVNQVISVLAGDLLAINGSLSLACSAAGAPSAKLFVGGVEQTPVANPTVGTTYSRIPVNAYVSVASDSTALPVSLTIAAAATTNTVTARNSIVNIIRHRR